MKKRRFIAFGATGRVEKQKRAERFALSALPFSHPVGARVTPQCCSILRLDLPILA